MNKHAVVIAGDFRTFHHARASAVPLLRDADVFLSTWKTSKFMHPVSRKVYDMGEFNVDEARRWFHDNQIEAVSVYDEAYSPPAWRPLGYNANYLHRIGSSIASIYRFCSWMENGPDYESVMFMRPDLFFNIGTIGVVEQLRNRIRSIQPETFLTDLSPPERVHKLGTVNDMLFAVHGTDIGKVVPTITDYQRYKHEDWHTFLCSHLKRQGFAIANVEGQHYTVLRPGFDPEQLNFWEARRTSEIWDNETILHCINSEGIKTAVRSWGKHAVLRAVGDIDES